MAENKYYYHVLTEDEKKQSLVSDYLVSDNVKTAIREKVLHTSAKGQDGKIQEFHDVFGSIAGIRTYMYGIDKKYSPALISKALDIFKINKLAFGSDFSELEVFKDDKTSAEILNFINLCLVSKDNSNWVPTFNSFKYDSENNDMFKFLTEKDIEIIKIKAGHVKGLIDDFGYKSTSVIKETGSITQFYNHINSERFEHKDNRDNLGVGANVKYVTPIEIDLLDAFETPIVDEEEYKKLFEVVKKVIKISHISEEFRNSIIFLLNNYYCLGQANPSYKSLYYLATQTSKFSLTDLIGAKKTIIDIMRFYKEKNDDTFDLFNTNITEKIGPSLILENDYFKRNKYII